MGRQALKAKRVIRGYQGRKVILVLRAQKAQRGRKASKVFPAL